MDGRVRVRVRVRTFREITYGIKVGQLVGCGGKKTKGGGLDGGSRDGGGRVMVAATLTGIMCASVCACVCVLRRLSATPPRSDRC